LFMLPDRQREYLSRIDCALRVAAEVARGYEPGNFHAQDSGGRCVVTEVDRRISHVLREYLLRPGEGWLSEEDPDDESRLSCNVVWVIDPLDGTREFVDGLPEWCISIGLVEDGLPIAGGTLNPAAGEIFLGAIGCGVTHDGCPVHVTARNCLDGAFILASRSECNRGEWQRFADQAFTVKPMGSVAYKLSRVAAGLADATWTLSPKHVWDVAAGVALVNSAGGCVAAPDGSPLVFNHPNTLLPGLVASGHNLWPEISQLLWRA
jgi:myo-inositol-1(or 4)-monophosphatase